ncbi:MAG: restriction endonuclease subunit S [Burkholderiales bacterium]
MKYAMYNEYKQSGTEWLGSIPIHWSMSPLKYVADIKTGYAFSSDDFADEGIPVIRISDITKEGKVDLSNVRFLPIEYSSAFKSVMLRSGDIVMAMTGATIGKVGWYEYERRSLLNQRVCSFEVLDKNYKKYLWYLLNSDFYIKYIALTAFGGAQPNISDTQLLGCDVPLPPLNEQQTIARFLDAKTAQIDELIAKKRQLIAKLKEKRQALIARTVTRGLPPEAAKAAGLEPTPEMKDSGVDWLGMVPASWRAKKLKRCGCLVAGAGFPHEHQGQEGEELPFFKVADLGQSADGVTLRSSEHSVSRETAALLRAKVVPAGSIAYAKIGAALLLNRRRITTVDCCIDNNMSAFVPRSGLISTGWAYYFLSIIDFSEFMNLGAIPSFSEGYQADLPILLPPLREQEAICAYLAAATSEIDAMVSIAEAAADRLLEYRNAVITSAVTGKIDLRELA